MFFSFLLWDQRGPAAKLRQGNTQFYQAQRFTMKTTEMLLEADQGLAANQEWSRFLQHDARRCNNNIYKSAKYPSFPLLSANDSAGIPIRSIMVTCKLASGVFVGYLMCRPSLNRPLPPPVSTVGRLS